MQKMRKKRIFTEQEKAVLRVNMAKARAALKESPNAQRASKANAGKATSVRTARAILKAMPLGATAGVKFTACQKKHLEVIDQQPQKNGNIWEQKFRLEQQVAIMGELHTFSGIVRIVWDYEPTLENIMDAPRFETVEKSDS